MPRVAVIVPLSLEGGLRDVAINVAEALASTGDCEVVFVAPLQGAEDPILVRRLRVSGVSSRKLSWKVFALEEAKAVARLARCETVFEYPSYAIPSDGANDLWDCDLWLFVLERGGVHLPVLPLRPMAAILLDCTQRYVPQVFSREDWVAQQAGLLPLLRGARCVAATTPATLGDVNSYFGLSRSRLHLLPLLHRELEAAQRDPDFLEGEDYILWPTRRSPDGNHGLVLQALELYYGELGGRLKTVVLGWGARDQEAGNDGYVLEIDEQLSRSKTLKENLETIPEQPRRGYAAMLGGARFVLNTNIYDNGSYPTVDAARFGIPSLSARYPAMEYLDATLDLGLTFFDSFDVGALAAALVDMEAAARPGPPRTLGAVGSESPSSSLRALVSECLDGGVGEP